MVGFYYFYFIDKILFNFWLNTGLNMEPYLGQNSIS